MSKMNLPKTSSQNGQHVTSIQNANKNFFKEHSDFFTFGPSQKSVSMIFNIINSIKVPFELGTMQLQHFILQVLQETALNELEIVYWSFVVESHVWNERENFRILLIFAALVAKERLTGNIEYLLQKYAEKEEKFIERYFFWVNGKMIREVSVKELNLRYKVFSKKKEFKINYSYYVDDIILHYSPYIHNLKIEKIGVKSEPVLPNIFQDDGQEQLNDNELPPLPLGNANSGGFSTASISLFIFSE